jgi:predicted  nucleic acid-binding Zn-ribbon protein
VNLLNLGGWFKKNILKIVCFIALFSLLLLYFSHTKKTNNFKKELEKIALEKKELQKTILEKEILLKQIEKDILDFEILINKEKLILNEKIDSINSMSDTTKAYKLWILYRYY